VRLDDGPERIASAVQSYARACEGLPQVQLGDAAVREVAFGRRIRIAGVENDGRPAVAFNAAGDLVAVLKRSEDGWLYPERVFLSPEHLTVRPA